MGRMRGIVRPLPVLLLVATVAACGTYGESPAAPPAEASRLEDLGAALPDFEDFPPFVEIAPEAVAPDLASHPEARRFRTAITEGAHRGAAFAGHLAVASWGCGTGCQQYAFIDARDGRVIWGPETSYGAAYVQHSRLFVANPPESLPRDEAGRLHDPHARPEPYVWDGERLVPLAAGG